MVLTNKSNNEILDLINQHSCDKNRIVKIDKHAKGDEFADCSIAHFSERIRAFVKIEDGCDRFCSYCIIPTSRGRVRSKPLESLKNEVKTLGENGIKEIVLVGINLSSYGKGENFDMVDAVRVCAEDKNISRVRLGSLEPDHITDEVIEGLAAIDKFCPQFHISLQSGCDRTLKNMNRHYTAAEYRALCEKLREVFDDCTLTTDVMVGFHDETEQDFEESLAFVKSIRFEKVHTFPYSEREGTAASRKGDNVPKQIKEERAAAMIKLADEMRLDYLNSIIGSDVEVLFENEISHGIYQGYTKNYVPVRLKSDIDIIGKELTVTLNEVDADNDCVIASL
ncbi:MAG: MiaB/RimO family radical SAM methylthiotransferase [Eubacterium sp.]|nr:MiaB/RimO family radical SAM methylthiotransferase [Eubacterium sp.]